MQTHQTIKQTIHTRKRLGMLFVALLILWGLVANDVLPVSASTPPDDTPVDQIFLPIVAGPCAEALDLRTPSVFGLQMYGDTSRQREYFPDMMASNASWVRIEVSWRGVEPVNVTPDQFDWTKVDSVLTASAQGGINMIGTINYNPAWAAESAFGPIAPEHLADFGQFITALVERYDGDGIDDDPCGRVVRHWEFFNEPDGNNVRWGNDGDRYADMLAAAYPAAKLADPDVQVLFGGIAYDWFEDDGGHFVRSFLTDVLDAGGGAYFDVMNFHVYPAFAPRWTNIGPGLAEKSAEIRAVLAGYGLNKPMMITESGAHSNDDPGSPSTPEIQASYVVELFTQAKAADIDTMIWFMLYDPAEWYPHKNGLVTNGTPPVRKLAFSTYQQSVEKLAHTNFDRELTGDELGDPDMLAYRFIKPENGAALYSAWMNPVNTDETAVLTLSGTQAVVYDIWTSNYTVHDGDDGQVDGQVTVTVGKTPLLIEIE